MSKKSFPKIPTKSSLEVLGLNIKLHASPDNLPDSRPICQSDFSYTMDHENSRWMLRANLEKVAEFLKIAHWQSTQATSFLQNLFFCNAFLCIQELVTYTVLQRNYCHCAKEPFFGMCFSVPFVPRSLVSASFFRKFYLLFLPVGNIVTEKVKEVFLRT